MVNSCLPGLTHCDLQVTSWSWQMRRTRQRSGQGPPYVVAPGGLASWCAWKGVAIAQGPPCVVAPGGLAPGRAREGSRLPEASMRGGSRWTCSLACSGRDRNCPRGGWQGQEQTTVEVDAAGTGCRGAGTNASRTERLCNLVIKPNGPLCCGTGTSASRPIVDVMKPILGDFRCAAMPSVHMCPRGWML